MTNAGDGNGWQAPGGSSDSSSESGREGSGATAPADPPGASAPEQPRYGQFAPPTGYGAPTAGYGAPAASDAQTYAAPVLPSAPVGWTPPPKPGIVPLRPLGFGALLAAPFRYLRHSRGVLGFALLLQVGLLVLIGLIGVAVFFGGFNRITDYTDPDQNPLIAGSIAASIIAAIGYLLLNLVVSAFIQGVVVVDMSLAVLGQKQSLRQLWQRVKPSFWALVRWTLLLSVAVIIALLVLTGIVLIGVAIGGVGLAISIGVTILLALGAIVLGVWLFVKFSITPSIIVLERSKALPAARRSWALTTGYFWRTLGAQLLTAAIIYLASYLISIPLGLLQFVGLIIDPTGSSGAAIAVIIVVYVLSTVVSLLIGTVGALVQAALVSLIYIDLRMRKEGLDLVLQRHVEQTGSSTANSAGSSTGYSDPSAAGTPADPYAPLTREFA
ncbi:hypothetical protein [Naasia lichenicola]|uniref:Glycerophosphoryl diester phosphodiesterase membrane domain-containing protein n=1 Tax=Naasia lichenicola TaxID=2565933 RepID=A0A4S4FQ44_9MICO|nr:hypothetical protein [Naasia lichenicola]THG30715.1 hypothetical protein E6C64_08730 [Naasia lichenicola]THG31952.1 hypothetical protein E6C64_07875 [Naasia lichenicola]